MPRTKSHRFSPSLVQLEPRDVPAGNVTAALVGGQLRVFGDAADNTVILRGKGPGVIEVQGVGTTVNGGTAKPTFTGVSGVLVDVADGNDTVRTTGLTVGEVYVFGGAGDDTLDLKGTTGRRPDGSPGLYLIAEGDLSYLPSSAPPENGDDAISISGTTVTGGYAVVYLTGDAFYQGDGGRDTYSVTDTRFDVGYMDVELWAGDSETGPGDAVTVSNFNATVSGQATWEPFYLYGTNHDDTFRLSNVHLTYNGYVDIEPDIFVGSYEGHDTIDAENMSVISTTEAVEGEFNFNQTWLGFIADTVHIRNLDFVGGGTFTGGFFDGPYLTGGSVGITAEDVDLQNVSVHTNGFGGLGIDTHESWIDGIPRDGTYTLTNVSVTAATLSEGGLYLTTGGGDDRVDVRNSSFENVGVTAGEGDDSVSVSNSDLGRYVNIDLGAGNDSLTFVNVDFNAHFVFPNGFETGGINAGGGNDTVSLTNCDCEALVLDMGDGDDVVNLTNCAFLAADLFGGDGTDDLNLTNSTGLFTVHGFEL